MNAQEKYEIIKASLIEMVHGYMTDLAKGEDKMKMLCNLNSHAVEKAQLIMGLFSDIDILKIWEESEDFARSHYPAGVPLEGQALFNFAIKIFHDRIDQFKK